MVRLALGAVAAALTLAACGPSAPSASPAPSRAEATSASASASAWTYDASYAVTAPPDLVPIESATCGTTPQPDRVAAENARPGTDLTRLLITADAPPVPIHLDRPSTVCGRPVGVHIDAAGAFGVTVSAYRVGWYSGAGARLVWRSQPLVVTSPHAWAPQVMLPVDDRWTPGLYVVVSELGGAVTGLAPLVVRSAAPAAPAVVQYSNLTWAAYSLAGSQSLYKGRDDTSATRATTVPLQRPVTGPGVLRLVVEDVPVAQELDRLGLVVDPVADTDVSTWPSLLAHRTQIVLPGHSEYWTRSMYDALTAARNAGANIVDLGANDLYWHARVEVDGRGTPVSMTVARTLDRDPLAASSPGEATVQWRQAPLGRDPSAVLGISYSGLRAQGSLVVTSVPDWLVGVPGLEPGALLAGVARDETNGLRVGGPMPPNLQVIALGLLRQRGARDTTAAITYYSTRFGGAVFSAGTTFWPCFVRATCPHSPLDPATRATVVAITERVLRGFAEPGFGARHPSVGTPVVPTADLRGTLPLAAQGSYGIGD